MQDRLFDVGIIKNAAECSWQYDNWAVQRSGVGHA